MEGKKEGEWVGNAGLSEHGVMHESCLRHSVQVTRSELWSIRCCEERGMGDVEGHTLNGEGCACWIV